MGTKTISFCQGKGSLSHNNRTFSTKNVDSTRTKDNVIFAQKSIEQAYDECFGAAVERYNDKQKRSDRKIKDGYFQYAFNRKPCDTVVVSKTGRTFRYPQTTFVPPAAANSPTRSDRLYSLKASRRKLRNPRIGNFTLYPFLWSSRLPEVSL